jgi:hypothetical protein
MSMSLRRASLLVMMGVTVCANACGSGRSNPPSDVPATTTPLIIEISGGFKYVHSPADHRVEIAFLKSTTGACTVNQLGVELAVKDGDIVVPASAPADKTFDPGGAVVTFGDNPAEALTATRGPNPGPPFHPANPDTPAANWEDLSWIPRVDTYYPGNPLNPNWRQMVDGRLVLTHGKLVAAKPSDVAAVTGLFQFKRASDGTTFQQSVTDNAIYTGQVPGDRVIINLANARSGISRIEIKPSGGLPVKLLLTGIHAGIPMMHPGDTITHYCAFYELRSPVPPMTERLLPVYIGDPALPLAGQPSPGAYCPGEF